MAATALECDISQIMRVVPCMLSVAGSRGRAAHLAHWLRQVEKCRSKSTAATP